jgi:hypothetical protein
MRLMTVFIVCSTGLLVGCSGGEDKWKAGRPKTVEAAGMITLNGKPLDKAQVVLVPQGGQNGGSALSDDEGAFQLASFPPDPGVVPGAYKVMIVKAIVPELQDEESAEAKTPQRAKLLIPKKYTDPKTSGLTVEVPEAGKKDILIELKE